MKYTKKYLVNALSIPIDHIIDKSKISLYFINSDEEYTMLYKQENQEYELYKIIKKTNKYNDYLNDYEIEFETESCTEDTFESLQKVKQGDIVEKNRVILKIDNEIIYIDDYINRNLTIANVVFENKENFLNFIELDFLEREISMDDEYNNIEIKLSQSK